MGLFLSHRRTECAGAYRSVFEPLETRSLLSVVNIADFGALASDGHDDADAITAAINASAPGDTLLFPGGLYELSREIDPLGGGRTFRGENGATLRTTAGSFAMHLRAGNAIFSQLSFQGRGLFFDTATGAMVEDVIVDNCRFNVAVSGGEMRNGIEFTTGLRNSRITNSRFENIADNGIYGYYWDNLTIANNEFVGGVQGIHIDDHRDSSRNLLIEQNHFSGLSRMGIEYQGGGYNSIIQDNYYEKPAMASSFSDNDNTFAYSIIADRSVNTIVRRNTSIAPERPDGVGVRIIFEVGGDNCIVEDNYSVGGNHVLAANDGTGTTSVLARNNRWDGYLQGPAGRGLTLSNNGPNVNLSWDINRAIPGPNRRLEGTAAPYPIPVAIGPAAPAGLQAEVQGASSVILSWKDMSTDERGFRIVRSTDGINWSQIGEVSANVTSYSASGLTAGRSYYFRVRAFNRFGLSDYTTSVRISLPAAEAPAEQAQSAVALKATKARGKASAQGFAEALIDPSPRW